MFAVPSVVSRKNSSSVDASKSGLSLARDVQSALATCAYSPVRGLTCEYGRGVVVVTGRLPSFYLKQVAITLVSHHLAADTRFDDAIEVE